MMGEKFLSMPKTMGDARLIYEYLELKYNMVESNFFTNASKLVEINNKIYDKHKNKTWLREKLNKIEHEEFMEDFNCGH